MLRATRNLALATSLCAVLLAGTAASADTLTASVTLNATIPPKVAFTPIDAGHVTVRSNCGWTIVAVGANGAVTLGGGKTAATQITLPAGTLAYTVVADH